MTRAGRVTTAALALTALLAAGCGYDITGAPTGGTSTRGEAPTPTTAGPAPSPDAPTAATADEAWALAGLSAPEGAQVVSALSRPNDLDLRSYLVQVTTTTEAAAALCEQTGGLLRTRRPLVEEQLDPFDLTAEPEGVVGTCGGTTNGEQAVVQRDVLVAEADGTTTVWLSAYELPR